MNRLILLALLFVLAHGAASAGGTDEGVGTLPAARDSAGTPLTFGHEKKVGKTIKVKPGETKTNEDVTVACHADSDGEARISGADPSSVRLKKDFMGTVEGLESDDSVLVGNDCSQPGGQDNSAEPFLSGTGGTITWGSGAEGWVSNTAPSSASYFVLKMPDGSTHHVHGGTTVWVTDEGPQPSPES